MPVALHNKPSVRRLNSLGQLRALLRLDIDIITTIAATSGRFYEPFDILKGVSRSGAQKWRHIDNPVGVLRQLQERVYTNILKPVAPALPTYLTGGMPGRSILDNANPHFGAPVVVGMDIEDCFPNISTRKIFSVWQDILGFGTEVSRILTQLTTVDYRLPQGSPASPMLCNLALAGYAGEVNEMAQHADLNFTIYIDDMTFSGAQARSLIGDTIKLADRHRLTVKRSKTVIMDANELQKTTGLVLNKGGYGRKQYAAVREMVVVASEMGNAVSKYDLNKIWGIIGHVKAIDPGKGLRLDHFARTRLADVIGQPGIKPSDVRRTCGSFERRH